MAQSGKITEIVDPKAFEQVERLQSDLVKLQATLQTITGTLIQYSNQSKNITPKEAIESTQKITKQKDLLIETMREEQALKNKLVTLEAKLNAATKLYGESQQTLAARIKLMNAQHEQAATATKQDIQQKEKLRQEINKLEKAYRDNATAAQAQAKNIGNYGSALKGVGSTIMGLLPIAGGLAGALALTNKAIMSTDTSADAFEQTMGALKGGFDSVMRSFATGDFSNLIKNFRSAAAAGREYVEAMQIIEDKTRGMSIREKILEEQMLRQELIFRDRTRAAGERAAAESKYRELSNTMMREAVQLADEELEATLKKAASDSGISKENIKRLIEEQSLNANWLAQAEARGKEIEMLKRVESSYLNTTTEKVVDNSEAYAEAQAKLKSYSDQQKASGDLALRFGKLNEDVRINLTNLVNRTQDLKNEELQRSVSLLRVANSIDKAAVAEGKLAEKTERSSVEMAKIPRIQKQAGDALVDFMVKAGFTAEEIIDIQERITKATEDNIDKQFKKRQEYSKDFEKLLEGDAKKEADILAKQKDVYQSVYGQIQDVITGFFAAAFESRQIKIDEELDQLEANKERELQLAGDNATKKAEIERKYQSEKERIDKKAKKLEYDKAVFNRLTASANIAYSTAEAVMKAVAAFPITGGMPWTAIIAALGALQVASVWAAPLPKFAKGTQNAPEGFAIVGERGSEMVIDNGRAYITPDTDTLTYLSKGAKVIPHDEVMQMAEAMGNPAIPKMTDKGLGYDISEIMNNVSGRIVSAIKNKQETHINITEAGMRKVTRSANGWTEYINKNIRH